MSFVDEADEVEGSDETGTRVIRDEFSQVEDEEAEVTQSDQGKINKSAEIRAEATRLIESGAHPRPVEIVRILEERGIPVAPAMVSLVLKKMGVQGRTRRSKSSSARPPARPPLPPVPERPLAAAPAKAVASATGNAFTLEQLIAAKAFVDEVGSPRQAMALLEALDRLLE